VPDECFIPSEEARATVRRRYSVNTIRDPRRIYELWLEFFVERVESEFFDAVGNTRLGFRSRAASGRHATSAEWAWLLVEWQVWLSNRDPPREPEAARLALRRIMVEMRADNEVIAAFDASHVIHAAAGIQNRISQRARAINRAQHQQHAATNDVLYRMWDLCETGWNLRDRAGREPSSWHKLCWYRVMACLGAWMAKQHALRASEYCHLPPRVRPGETIPGLRRVEDQHAFRPNDISVTTVDGTVIRGRDMWQYASMELQDVEFITVNFWSAKNITAGNYSVDHVRPGVSPMLDDYLRMHLIWMQFARWWPNDLYFSMRYPFGEGEYKRLIPKMVVELERAAVVTLGGDSRRYGTRSLKIGCITELYHAGASEQELMATGRHASFSANRHYRRSVADGSDLRAGPLAVPATQSLTIQEVAKGGPGITMDTQNKRPRRGGR